MTDKNTNNFAIEWSEDVCDWIMEKATEDELDPEVAVYGALAAAVVLARSVGMNDADINERIAIMLSEEFPESMME
jgi:hypothetical protein